MPLLSIIITVYNLENYIEKCLESVLSQKLDDYEILLVNDASTDRSGEICDAYARKYKEIRYFCTTGEKVIGKAHLIGFSKSRGRYCHFIDGDDYLANGCYWNILDVIQNKEPDIIFGSFQCIPEKGARYLQDAILDPERINNASFKNAVTYLAKIPNLHGVCWRFIFKKCLLQESDLKAEFKAAGYGGDELFIIDLFARAKSVFYYDQPFYCYRMRSNQSLTHMITNEHFKNYFKNISYMLKRLHENPVIKDLILSRIQLMLNLFSAGCDRFTSDELKDLVNFIKKLKYLYLLEEISKPNDLFDFTSRFGEFVGLTLYCVYETATILELVQSQREKDIFVFPTGNSGEGTARRLRQAGFSVCGFLDNSDHKSETLINGIPCYKPSVLTKLSPEKIDKTVIVISTAYEHLKPILKKQLLNLGFPVNQILIKK